MSGADTIRDGARIGSMDISVERARSDDTIRLRVRYELRVDDRGPKSVIFADPEIGILEDFSVPAGFAIERSRRDWQSELMISCTTDESLSGQVVQAVVRCDQATRASLHGSPVFALPSLLPQLVTQHGLYYGSDLDAPVGSLPAPRLRLQTAATDLMATVTDDDGNLLAAMLPMNDDFGGCICVADDAIIFAGVDLGSTSPPQRSAAHARLRRMHQFLDGEYGNGSLIRALVFSAEGSQGFHGGEGQLCAIEYRNLEPFPEYDRFYGEAEIVRQLAMIWWTYGVRPSGLRGDLLANGLAIYSSFRWFEALGEPAEVDERIRRWRTIVNEMEEGRRPTSDSVIYAVRTAFALFAARGQPLQDELRSWCSQDWGFAVPAPELVRRLQRVGVRLPA